MDLEVQVVVVASCITSAAISFTAGYCWNNPPPPHCGRMLNHSILPVLRVQCRDLFGCLFLKCLARLPADPPMQLIMKEHPIKKYNITT